MQLSFGQQIKLQSKILRIYAIKTFSWRTLSRVFCDIFVSTDTTTVRIMLANASMFWAVIIFSNPAVMTQEPFAIMSAVGDNTFWIAAFLAHFAGVYWRACDPAPQVFSGLIINGYGFLLWFFTSVAINYNMEHVNPGTALEIVICSASAWALFKTGSNPGYVES